MGCSTAYHCRCRVCQARKALKHHPDLYKIPPACKCGARNWRLDNYRMKNGDKDRGGVVCKLDCLPFFHRTNTKGCKQYEEKALDKSLTPNNKAGKVSPDEPPNF